MKAQADTPAAPEDVVATPNISRNETASPAPTQASVRRLDEMFLRSTFQQVKAVDAEIQAGIEAIVALQLEATTSPAGPPAPELDPVVQEVKELAQEVQEIQETAAVQSNMAEEIPVETAPKTPFEKEVTASGNVTETETLEPSLEEVAEAVFSESQTTTTSKVSEQETPAPAAATMQAARSEKETAEAAPLKTGSPKDIEETSRDSSGPQVTASDVASPSMLGSDLNPEASKEVAGLLDQLAADAEAARAMHAGDPSHPYAKDAFMKAALSEQAGGFKPQEGLRKDPSQEALGSAVDSELSRREGEILRATEQAEAASVVPDQPRRLPRNLQTLYLQPLRRVAEWGVPTCDLQLRSYSIRPLESFCDFALRAAYYLGLPAYGPVPLPKITERWTVPRSSFIFKKSQENFERITRRRLIQIRDGPTQPVQMWLAFLQKHQQAAVGMKANVWEFSSLGKSTLPKPLVPVKVSLVLTLYTDVAKEMDKAYEEAQEGINKSFEFLGQTKSIETAEKVDEILQSERYRAAGGR